MALILERKKGFGKMDAEAAGLFGSGRGFGVVEGIERDALVLDGEPEGIRKMLTGEVNLTWFGWVGVADDVD